MLYPPSVKAWDGDRTSINPSSLLPRSNLIRHLLEHEKTRFGKQTLAEHVRQLGTRSADDIIDLVEELLFAVRIPSAVRDQVRTLAGDGRNEHKLNEAIHALCTVPEFQLC